MRLLTLVLAAASCGPATGPSPWMPAEAARGKDAWVAAGDKLRNGARNVRAGGRVTAHCGEEPFVALAPTGQEIAEVRAGKPGKEAPILLSTGTARVTALACSGNQVYGLVVFTGTLRFGEKVVASAGSSDCAVVALREGKPAWIQRFGGRGTDTPGGLVFADGNVFMAMGGYGFVRVGLQEYQNHRDTKFRGYLIAISDGGNLEWSRAFESASGILPIGIGVGSEITVASNAVGNKAAEHSPSAVLHRFSLGGQSIAVEPWIASKSLVFTAISDDGSLIAGRFRGRLLGYDTPSWRAFVASSDKLRHALQDNLHIASVTHGNSGIWISGSTPAGSGMHTQVSLTSQSQ